VSKLTQTSSHKLPYPKLVPISDNTYSGPSEVDCANIRLVLQLVLSQSWLDRIPREGCQDTGTHQRRSNLHSFLHQNSLKSQINPLVQGISETWCKPYEDYLASTPRKFRKVVVPLVKSVEIGEKIRMLPIITRLP
jgi:hypothetical protein